MADPRRVLILDGDQNEAERVAGITREGGFVPLAVRSVEKAMDAMRWGAASAVIISVGEGTPGGWEFAEGLNGAVVALILLSDVPLNGDQVLQALGLGVAEVLRRPVDGDLLLDRLRRRRPRPVRSRGEDGVISGVLEETSAEWLLRTLETHELSARLDIEDIERGDWFSVVMRQGRICSAQGPGVAGTEAVIAALALPLGRFILTPLDDEGSEPPTSDLGPVSPLIEAALTHDDVVTIAEAGPIASDADTPSVAPHPVPAPPEVPAPQVDDGSFFDDRSPAFDPAVLSMETEAANSPIGFLDPAAPLPSRPLSGDGLDGRGGEPRSGVVGGAERGTGSGAYASRSEEWAAESGNPDDFGWSGPLAGLEPTGTPAPPGEAFGPQGADHIATNPGEVAVEDEVESGGLEPSTGRSDANPVGPKDESETENEDETNSERERNSEGESEAPGAEFDDEEPVKTRRPWLWILGMAVAVVGIGGAVLWATAPSGKSIALDAATSTAEPSVPEEDAAPAEPPAPKPATVDHRTLGLSAARDGQYETAVDELTPVWRTTHEDIPVGRWLAESLEKLGRAEERLAVLKELSEANGDKARLHLEYGLALRAKGQREAAKVALDRYLELSKDDPKSDRVRKLRENL